MVSIKFQVVSELKRKRGQPWPAARDAHAACCLGFGSENPQLLIIGGIDPYDEIIGDAWIFDLSSQTWREVYSGAHNERRRGGGRSVKHAHTSLKSQNITKKLDFKNFKWSQHDYGSAKRVLRGQGDGNVLPLC